MGLSYNVGVGGLSDIRDILTVHYQYVVLYATQKVCKYCICECDPQALVYEHSGPQNLEIELFDEDTDQDDFLGRLMIDPNPLGSFLSHQNHLNIKRDLCCSV